MADFIYNILIQPLVFLIDVLFCIIYGVTKDPGISVVLLSVIVNLIALPLYRQADLIQKEQEEKQRKLRPAADHIRSAFKGDERYMMLSAYYRIEKYNPISVMKESFPLLLQVPIFIAAYRYLSTAPVMKGNVFGPIADLGKPDAMLQIGGICVNFLPILMTALNLLSGFIYSREQNLRQKFQILSIAVIFLLLLYNSPAGLVLYWTTSQLFSLCKNLALETNVFKNRAVILTISFGIILIAITGIASGMLDTPGEEIVSEVLLIFAVMQLIRVILELKDTKMPAFLDKLKNYDELLPDNHFTDLLFVCISAALLYGICIPSSVLSSSASEFVDSSNGKFLTTLLTYPAEIYAGLFMIWISVFYYFSDKKGRKTLFSILLIILSSSLLNYFVFDIKPDFYYSDLTFDNDLTASAASILLNLLLSAGIGIACIVLWKKRGRACQNVAVIVAASLLLLGGYNISRIPSSLAEERIQTDTGSVITLSRNEENVIVFMLDRVMGAYIPYIMEEKPELKKAFDGFTFYPNTLSFGVVTKYGAPPLYGGYEYTPEAIIQNKRLSVEEMRKEALRVLPVLFSEKGFRTTVSDPALFDISLYDDYPDINAVNMVGKFNDSYLKLFDDSIRPVQKRNFAVFSIYKTVPIILREKVYSDGSYININNLHNAYTQAFIDNYAALKALPEQTRSDKSAQGSFLFLQNATAHEPNVLMPPDYEITAQNSSGDIPYGERIAGGRILSIKDLNSWKEYAVTVATCRMLENWLNKLKSLGVYDNTRIILAADHGVSASHAQFPEMVWPDGRELTGYNPVLMIKDFEARGEMSVSEDFMTNADVAKIATDGVIKDAANPFTGKSFGGDEKKEGVLIKSGSSDNKKDGAVPSMSDYKWWRVKDDIFDLNNWEAIEYEAE